MLGDIVKKALAYAPQKIDQGRACVRRSAPLHFPVKSSQDWVCSPCTPIIELKLCIFSQVKGELQRQVGVRLVNRFEEVRVEYLKGDARPRSRHQVSTDIPHPSHSRETSRLAYLFSNEPENNDAFTALDDIHEYNLLHPGPPSLGDSVSSLGRYSQ